ncbi:MAG TPA: chemotaxis protein CheW [Azospirillum sp.]|nr:chemotaxis protein CheW [Azospirillum sp.]
MTGGFFTFECAGAWFAVDAALVVEVAESQPVTRLPFSPPQVEGVSGIGGRILPQVNLGGYAALGLGRRESGRLLVVVRSRSGMLALRVARVGGTVPAGSVTLNAPALGPEAADLPIVARFVENGREVLLLDPARIEIGHGMAFAELADDAVLAGGPPEDLRAQRVPTVRLLVVEAGAGTLALEMDDLVMVFEVSDIRPLPNAPSVVRGMTQTHRRPVLLVDALAETDGDSGYAVVFATPHGPVGLRVDGIRGVVRFPAHAKKGTETAEGGVANEIVEYDGRWLEVRSGTGMLSDHLDSIGRLVPTGGVADAVQDMQPRPTRRFLTFTVGSRAYAIEFERVQRVVEFGGRHRLPGDITTFDGITDVDGAILPVLDLRRVLDKRPDRDGGQAGVSILVQAGGGTVAIIADEIQRIRKIPADAVDPMSDAITSAVIQLEGRLVPVLRPEGLMTPQPVS